MHLYRQAKEFWNKHGWHILLIGLLIVFVVLFIINHLSYHSPSRYVSLGDIYEYFMSLLFNPHQRTVSSSRRYSSRPRQQSSGGGGSSRGETKCKEFVEFFFQLPFEKIRPDFLRNPVTGENLELDMFNHDLKLAIEYNGSQHYQFNSFMHNNSKDKFYNQQYRDLIKKDLCEKNNIQLVIVPYTIPEHQIASFLFTELKKLGFTPHPDALGNLR